MNKLPLLMAAFIVTGFADVAASDKAARRDHFEKNITAKERELVKEARRNPSFGQAPVVVNATKPKSSPRK